MIITFGYNKQFGSILRAIIAVALGIVLFLFKEEGITTIVRIIGIAILFAGVISLLPQLSRGKQPDRGNRIGNIIGWTTCGIASLLGLLVVLKPEWFTTLFIFITAAAIIIFCAIQLIALISVMSMTGFVAMPMVLTCLSLVGAIVVMFFAPGKVICIVTGVLLVIYGITEIMALRQIKQAEIHIYGSVKDQEPAAGQDRKDPGLLLTSAKDADFEEVRK